MAKIKAKISLSRSSLEHRTKVTLLSTTEITHVNHVLLDLPLIKKSQLFSFSFSYGHSGCFIIIINILRSTTAAAVKIKNLQRVFSVLKYTDMHDSTLQFAAKIYWRVHKDLQVMIFLYSMRNDLLRSPYRTGLMAEDM